VSERFLKIVFVLSFGVLCLVYGVVAVLYNLFPAPQIIEARATIIDVATYWKNDLALEPTRHLVPADDPERVVYRVLRPDLVPPGATMIGGLAPDRDRLQGVTLYDELGVEIHHWSIDYEALDPGGEDEENVMLHGLLPFPDGSIAVAFDNGNVIARVDACGKPIWVTPGRYHHVVSAGDDGILWSWVEEVLMKLDAGTGEVLDEINLKTDLIEGQDLYGVFAIHTDENPDGITYHGSAFHANDVEPLTRALAPAFPEFEPGDLLISLRELNLVAVLDPDTRELKWWIHGPWFRQHDPDFEPDGRISVFDNHMGLGASRIVLIDPKTNEWEVVLQGSDELPFYTWQRGTHQILPNGDILVTEPERGRVFMTDGEGDLIWVREMIFDAEQNYIVTTAIQVPPGFFDDDAFACAGTPDMQ